MNASRAGRSLGLLLSSLLAGGLVLASPANEGESLLTLKPGVVAAENADTLGDFVATYNVSIEVLRRDVPGGEAKRHHQTGKFQSKRRGNQVCFGLAIEEYVPDNSGGVAVVQGSTVWLLEEGRLIARITGEETMDADPSTAPLPPALAPFDVDLAKGWVVDSLVPADEVRALRSGMGTFTQETVDGKRIDRFDHAVERDVPIGKTRGRIMETRDEAGRLLTRQSGRTVVFHDGESAFEPIELVDVRRGKDGIASRIEVRRFNTCPTGPACAPQTKEEFLQYQALRGDALLASKVILERVNIRSAKPSDHIALEDFLPMVTSLRRQNGATQDVVTFRSGEDWDGEPLWEMHPETHVWHPIEPQAN